MLEPTLTNLRIVSKVQAHDKLSVAENTLYISMPTWTRPIRRAFTRNDRSTSLEALQGMVVASIELTNTLMNSVTYSSDTPISARQKHKDHCSLKNLFETMSSSLVGFENLKKSYAEDPSYIASLEGLVVMMHDQLEILRGFFHEGEGI